MRWVRSVQPPVVSGHIRGLTNTLPLHVEILYNEYQFQAAFAAASLLAFLALVTLAARALVEWRSAEARALRPEDDCGARLGNEHVRAALARWRRRFTRFTPSSMEPGLRARRR